MTVSAAPNVQKQLPLRPPYQFKPDTFQKARARVDALLEDRGYKETKHYLENKLNHLNGAERIVTYHAYKYLQGKTA